MKIALLGAGRTGSKVKEAAKGHAVTEFTEHNPPTITTLADHDVVISFLPGDAMASYLPMLVESGIPVVNGSTGFEWPADIDNQLQQHGVAWITASNFALGMNLVKAMIRIMAKAPNLLPSSSYHIHEVHHIHKKDSPSGTAKSWAKWLDRPVEFSDDREGDVVGIHTLTMDSEFEQISLRHEAKDRAVFASGAVWTAEYVLSHKVEPGLHELSTIMEKELGL